MKKTHLYWKLGIIFFFLIGYFFLTYPFLKNTLIHYKIAQQQGNEHSNFQSAKVPISDFQYDEIQPPSLTDVLWASDPTGEAVGEIVSDRIGLHLSIFAGANQSNLLAGAATLSPNQKIGEGNYVLLGHHMKDESLLFSPIMNLKKGDIVYLRDENTVYQYRMEETEVVHESKVSVMKDKGDHRLTLITCDKATATNHRFIATGFLVKSESVKKQQESIVKQYENVKGNLIQQAGKQSYWYALILAVYVLLFVVISIRLWKTMK
ncbi:class A sortase [Bacillus cereus]|uniref:class A sortase n=1 Tax=Bacillus cereus TaxID=1396 RepID=UPI000BFA4309|nr:class A sortase [Bacillus cereus]PEX06524.1 class A sortase [Bacillus cereus]PGV20717.1 class A sortase [Bacillus cereus]